VDWDKLRIFHAVAEAGSFTAAGNDLGLSQSAVSRQISTLEDDLKTKLFNRHARGLVMTEQGEMMYRTAHEMSTRFDAARTRLTDSRDKPFGAIKITTTVGLGSMWLTPRIKEFSELYPDISIELLLSNTELDLATREADIAIRLRQPIQSSLIQRRLFIVHNHTYASIEYLKRYGTPKTLEDLDDHKIITYGHQIPSYLTAMNLLETAGLPEHNLRRVTLSINNVHGIKLAVRHGIGLAVMPDYIADGEPNFVRIMTDLEIPDLDAYFVYPEELRNSKRIAVFRDFLVAQARQWSF
jgi:DNA-binding transcriptional LysR family regulator